MYSFIGILILFHSGTVIDSVFGSLNSTNSVISEILSVLTIFGILILLDYVIYVTWLYFSGYFSTVVTQKMRVDIFESLQYHSQKFYEDQSTGDLISKSTADLQAMVRFFIGFMVHIPLLSGQFLFIITFLFYISPSIGFLGLLSIPPVLLIMKYFEKRNSPLIMESREDFGQMTKVLQENIDGILVSKIFNASDRNDKRFDNKNTNYRRVRKKSIFLQSMTSGQNVILTGIVTSFVLLIGGIQVMSDELSIGALISALMIINFLNSPLREMIDFTSRISEYKASSDRINDILETLPSIVESENTIDLQDPEGGIRFKDVSFSFGNEPVLNNVNMTIPANSTIALLGTTGSGKSSLINLIIRFYDVIEGQVLIDGFDVRDLTLNSLRKNIGFVDQETFLFSRSLKDNIRFGSPLASDEEITHVARIAQIHDFIQSLPDGYDTIIGERGITLSGGQRQRLSIARALLTDPKIIIFDDSLSAVDLKTERRMQEALDEIFIDKTVIFVTQRLSLISSVNKIIILDKGKIIEQGTHEELVTVKGAYNRLFKSRIDDIVDLSVINEAVEELT
jgi:ABC-type multidrug transport system fused ATPase/permease subunit